MSRFEMKLTGEVLRIVEKHEANFAGRTEFVRHAIIQYDQADYIRKIVREEISKVLDKKEQRFDDEKNEGSDINYEPLSFEE